MTPHRTGEVLELTREIISENRARHQEAFNSLPAFDLRKAQAGEPYTDYLGVIKRRSYTDIRLIEEPNPGWLVWVGEWTVYGLDEEEQMYAKLRMAPPARIGGAR